MKPFEHNGKTFRVIRKIVRESNGYGYLGSASNQYNVLQVKTKFMFWTSWRTIEREHIPAFAWIQQATLGSTDWQSTLLQKLNNKSHPIFIS